MRMPIGKSDEDEKESEDEQKAHLSQMLHEDCSEHCIFTHQLGWVEVGVSGWQRFQFH